jgi:hypothetical protein
MESIFGGLIQFNDKEQIESFMNSIDTNGSLKIIEMALLFSQKNGLFSFEESHIIYECLKKIKYEPKSEN